MAVRTAGPADDSEDDALRTDGEERDDVARLVGAIAVIGRQTDEASVLDHVALLAADLCDADGAAVLARTTDLGGWEVVAQRGAPDLVPAAIGPVLDALQPPPHGEDAPGDLVTDAPEGALAALLRTSRDRVGVVVVTGSRGGFDHRDRLLLDGLVRRAGVAVDAIRQRLALAHQVRLQRAALDERDEVVRILQQSLWPAALPTIAGLDLAAIYRPMIGGIGGDFYDLFPLRGSSWGVVVGDVCGKGPTAAAVTALGRHGVHTASMAHAEPGRALEVLNELLVQQRLDDRSALCTALFAHVRRHDDGVRLVTAIAGHPSPIVLRDDGTIDTFPPTGPLLGLFRDVSVGQLTIELAPGDTCVLYTDGATDVRGPGGTFGEDRLHEVIAGCRGMHAGAVVKSIERAVVDYQDGQLHDDLAVLALAVPPLREPASRR